MPHCRHCPDEPFFKDGSHLRDHLREEHLEWRNRWFE